MGELSSEGIAPDLGMVLDRIITKGIAAQVGGAEYVHELYASAYVRSNLGHYVGKIREAAAARRALDTLAAAREAVLDPGQRSLGEVIADTTAKLGKLATTSNAPTRFQASTAVELLAAPRKHDWLVRGLVERGTLVMPIGKPASGKSLVATDICLSVSAALEWNGRSTSPGGFVVLVIGEGQTGAVRRIAAWCVRHQIGPESLALAVIREAGDLADEPTAIALRDSIARAAAPFGGRPALILVDTLARYFRGDENSASDTGRFIGNVDTHLREHFGATVMVVHHAGWGDNARGRGSSALHAAVDLELLVERQPGDNRALTVTCTKAKDIEPPEPMAFAIRTVELDERDDDGRQITSVVIDPVAPQSTARSERGLGASQATALATLRKLYDEQRATLETSGRDPDGAMVLTADWRAASGIPRQRWHDAIGTLTQRGLVEISGPHALLGDRPS